MNKKLIAPIVTAAAMLATSVGSTFALFSSKASSRIDIEAGKVQVDLTHTIDWAVSHYEKGEEAFDAVAAAEETEFDALFENGNTAVISGSEVESTIELDRFTPLDQIAVNMVAENSSNINIKWRYYLELSGDLIPALDINFGGVDYSTTEAPTTGDPLIVYGDWSEPVEPSVIELMDLDVVVTFPDHGEDDNQYQKKLGLIKLGIEAVQGNAQVGPLPVTTYGFHDSYQAEDGHWVHEISNKTEFKNLVTNENSTTPETMYPGYEDPKTEFVVIDNIDLGGNLWEDCIDVVSNYIFTGTLRGLDNVVISNYTQTTPYSQTSMMGSNKSMGLFNSAVCATFDNLNLSNFVLDNNNGKVCGLLTAGWSEINQPDIFVKTGCELIAAEEVLFLDCENINVDATCSMNISANAGSLIGQARQVQNLTFKDCYSSAYINGNSGANIGGLLGSSSVWSQITKVRTYVFENCTFAGTITTNGANIAGLAAQITVNNAINDITVKNCDMAGTLISTYSANINNMSGIYIANVAEPSPLSTSTFAYVDNSFTGTFIATLKALGVSGYNYEMAIESVKDFYKQVIPANLPKVEMGFDANNKLEVTNKASITVEYDSVLVQIKAHKNSISIARATDDAIKNSPTILYNQEFATIEDMEEATGIAAPYKVTRLGYFLPTEDTEHPTNTKSETAEFEYFMMDYAHKNETAYADGYHVDTNGAYFIRHNDNASVDYIAFGNTSKNPTYSIVLRKDGLPVAHGDLNKLVTNVTPYGA